MFKPPLGLVRTKTFDASAVEELKEFVKKTKSLYHSTRLGMQVTAGN